MNITSTRQKRHQFPKIAKEFGGTLPSAELVARMPRDLMEEVSAFVLADDNGRVIIAAADPGNVTLTAYVKRQFGEKAVVVETTHEHVTAVLKHHAPNFALEIEHIVTPHGEVRAEINGNISKLVDYIIRYALSEKVSDVHIEPKRNEAHVRFRVDGILHTKQILPRNIYTAVIARLKVLANLKIDETRRPQDGRIELLEGEEASMRVSLIPTLFGEKMVLRLLDESGNALSVEDVGFSSRQKEILLRNIEKPYGMIVASGPTGSGKTTTLYALLQLLKKEGLNISTLEDPIEGALSGVNQIQVNQSLGLTFASGLRSLLRQDPDVIMVGEIRDPETAIMASNAAMTGHLVFSTMHTNDASSAFVRFLEMGVGDYVVASTVNLVVAQRLVRRVCPSCVKDETLDEHALRQITGRTDIMAVLSKKRLTPAGLKSQTFKKGTGCEKCFETGYLGRAGIFELIEPNKEIRDLVLAHASAERIQAAARKQDSYEEMIADGVEKVRAGVTTFAEVLHATRSH